jgi:ribosomal RNA assembly protein
MEYVKIPEDRVAVLIGEKGAVKKEIEDRTKAKLALDENTVSIEGTGLGAWKARDMVQAIGRGFNPVVAFLLMNDDYVLRVLSLKDFAANEKAYSRLKGRVIGERGRVRRFLEKNTGAMISVYGKTVALIGSYDEVEVASEAVRMLLSGSQHGAVRRFLEKRASQR